MWAEGYLATKEAAPLLEEINQDAEPKKKLQEFLQQQENLAHISPREAELMSQYREIEQPTQPPHDIAEIRQTIMSGLLDSGLSAKDALRYAMEVEESITKDPLASLESCADPAPTSRAERVLAERREQAAITGSEWRR